MKLVMMEILIIATAIARRIGRLAAVCDWGDPRRLGGVLVRRRRDHAGLLLPTLVVGVPLMWFLGRLLDRLHADVRIWLLAAVVGAATAGFFPPARTKLYAAVWLSR